MKTHIESKSLGGRVLISSIKPYHLANKIKQLRGRAEAGRATEDDLEGLEALEAEARKRELIELNQRRNEEQ